MKRNGFISTTLIYTFFITILLLLVFLLNSYTRSRFLVEEIVYQIKDPDPEPDDPEFKDLNLFVYVNYLTDLNTDIQVENIPQGGFVYIEEKSKCDNGSTMEYYKRSDGKMSIKITSSTRDICRAYFKELPADIVFTIHTRDNEHSDYNTTVNEVPNANYKYDYTKCTDANNANIELNDLNLQFDPKARKFTYNTGQKAYCDAYFTRNPADIILNYYYEDTNGETEYKSKKYKKIDAYNSSYTYTSFSYYCNTFPDGSNHVTSFKEITKGSGQFEILANGKAECNVYLNR